MGYVYKTLKLFPMKTILTLVLMAVISISSNAQSEFNYSFDYSFFMIDYTPIQYTPKKDVNAIEFTVTDRKGKQVKFKKEFIEGNKIVKFQEIKNGQTKREVENKYSSSGHLEEMKVKKKEELKYTISYKRNNDEKPTEQKMVLPNGNVKFTNVWIYNGDGCLQEYSRFKKNQKLYKKNTYEYFSPCEKSKMHLYNGKGKLKKTWTFDCKKEGEELVVKKDVKQVCKWEEADDKYLIKVYQTFDEKGRIYKNVSKYTMEDTLIVESKSYNKNGVMTHMATYDKSYKRPIIRNYYNSKGKLKWGNKFEYIDGQVVSYERSRNGKLLNTSTYEYNTDQLLTKFIAHNKKGELSRTIELQYN